MHARVPGVLVKSCLDNVTIKHGASTIYYVLVFQVIEDTCSLIGLFTGFSDLEAIRVGLRLEGFGTTKPLDIWVYRSILWM